MSNRRNAEFVKETAKWSESATRGRSHGAVVRTITLKGCDSARSYDGCDQAPFCPRTLAPHIATKQHVPTDYLPLARTLEPSLFRRVLFLFYLLLPSSAAAPREPLPPRLNLSRATGTVVLMMTANAHCPPSDPSTTRGRTLKMLAEILSTRFHLAAGPVARTWNGIETWLREYSLRVVHYFP